MSAHRTPPPPTSEPTAATDMKPPPLSAAQADAPPSKRKLEEVGFHHSPYYKIRAAVANLRGRFLQVLTPNPIFSVHSAFFYEIFLDEDQAMFSLLTKGFTVESGCSIVLASVGGGIQIMD